MKVLLLGFGSIGNRHFEILRSLDTVSEIHLVTKQYVEQAKCFHLLSDIMSLEVYDYFVISSETVKHFEQLKYICSKVKNKKILVEKPLYDKNHKSFIVNNKVYTAYNLRFHPIIMKLKELLEGEDIYYANILCGQYLPSWRPDRDYRQSYSADINCGGGVLRDLSHELDYMSWLFGEFESFQSINTKRSDLEINSDDIFTAIGVTASGVVANVTVDYISKRPIRKVIVHTKDLTIEADVINSTILVSNKSGETNAIELGVEGRNYTYLKMHKAILSNHGIDVCSFEEGLKTVEFINSVDFKEM